MSVAYGGPTGGYAPPGRVNFGWIGEAFNLFKANAAVWIVAGLMLFVVPAVVGGIIGGIYGASAALHPPVGGPPAPFGTNPYGRMNPYQNGLPIGLNLVIQVLSFVYTSYLYGGIYRIAVKQVRGEMTSIGDLFSGGPLMLTMLGFQLIYLITVLVGSLLCIIPGLLAAGLLFPAYALIADGESLSNSISRSVDAMKRDLWNAAAFTLVMSLLVIASYLAFCLGEFVTFPMFWLVAALAYRDMIGMPGIAAPASPYGAAPYGTPPPGVWPPPPGQAPPPGPSPSFGQSAPPPAAPPRRTLGGDPLDDDGNAPPPSPPPGGMPPR
jgi:uncharacterized membrane protein